MENKEFLETKIVVPFGGIVVAFTNIATNDIETIRLWWGRNMNWHLTRDRLLQDVFISIGGNGGAVWQYAHFIPDPENSENIKIHESVVREMVEKRTINV